jgi:hypothetical protein
VKDPIIDEIHKAREEYAKKFNFDIDAMFKDLQARQAGNPKLVDLSKETAAGRSPKRPRNGNVARP